MLNFKDIRIEDKSIFDRFLKPYLLSTHEYNFTNLFLWKDFCKTQFCLYKDSLIIKKKDYYENATFFMQPVGYDPSVLPEIMEMLIKIKNKENLEYVICDAEKAFIDELERLFPGSFIFNDQDGSADYIYEKEKFTLMQGAELQTKRHHYNHFIKHFSYEIRSVTDENIEECNCFVKAWCHENNATGSLAYEGTVIGGVLNQRKILGYDSMVIYVNDKISALMIGEKLNENTGVIHVEKADKKIKGLYNFLKKAFTETYFSELKYVNWEQDLGLPGLRKVKSEYMPYKLEPKFSVSLKKK
jgi:uncharacterized protein